MSYDHRYWWVSRPLAEGGQRIDVGGTDLSAVPVACPERVEKWYVEGFRKEFHDQLRRDLLKLRDACCLVYGKDPDKLPIGKDRPDGATWNNNSPGIDSVFSFCELARFAILNDKLEAIEDPEDPQGKFLVTPSAIFGFALKHGVFEFVPDQEGAKKSVLRTALCTVWSEAIAEQVPIAESEAHERSAHPSEKWITNKDAADLFREKFPNVSDGAARTAITTARKSDKIKGRKKDSGFGYLVEKGSVMYFLKELQDVHSDNYDPFDVEND